jgi:hypothetical protein
MTQTKAIVAGAIVLAMVGGVTLATGPRSKPDLSTEAGQTAFLNSKDYPALAEATEFAMTAIACKDERAQALAKKALSAALKTANGAPDADAAYARIEKEIAGDDFMQKLLAKGDCAANIKAIEDKMGRG